MLYWMYVCPLVVVVDYSAQSLHFEVLLPSSVDKLVVLDGSELSDALVTQLATRTY